VHDFSKSVFITIGSMFCSYIELLTFILLVIYTIPGSDLIFCGTFHAHVFLIFACLYIMLNFIAFIMVFFIGVVSVCHHLVNGFAVYQNTGITQCFDCQDASVSKLGML